MLCLDCLQKKLDSCPHRFTDGQPGCTHSCGISYHAGFDSAAGIPPDVQKPFHSKVVSPLRFNLCRQLPTRPMLTRRDNHIISACAGEKKTYQLTTSAMWPRRSRNHQQGFRKNFVFSGLFLSWDTPQRGPRSLTQAPRKQVWLSAASRLGLSWSSSHTTGHLYNEDYLVLQSGRGSHGYGR